MQLIISIPENNGSKIKRIHGLGFVNRLRWRSVEKNRKKVCLLLKIILQLIRSDVQLTADAKRKHGH